VLPFQLISVCIFDHLDAMSLALSRSSIGSSHC